VVVGLRRWRQWWRRLPAEGTGVVDGAGSSKIACGINDGNVGSQAAGHAALAQAIKSAVVVLIDRGGNRGPRIALFSSRKPLAMDPSCTRPAQEGATLESKGWAGKAVCWCWCWCYAQGNLGLKKVSSASLKNPPKCTFRISGT
jgi:hypothetical protein